MKIMKGMLAGLLAATIAVPMLACSSSSNGGGGGYGITNCPLLGVPSACVSCLKSNCGSQVATVDSACSTYYDCICPAYQDAAVLESCTESASCAQATATGMSECGACQAACSFGPDAG